MGRSGQIFEVSSDLEVGDRPSKIDRGLAGIVEVKAIGAVTAEESYQLSVPTGVENGSP